MLNAGADPNIGLTLNFRDPSSDGKTPLHTASFEGHTEIVKALIASDKTNINRFTTNGETALDIAKKKGHTEIIQVLEEKMKEKSIGDKRGAEESPSNSPRPEKKPMTQHER